MLIYYRVDGGNVYSLGMGHVYRCLKFADYTKKRGIDSVFIMKDIEEGINKVKERGYKVIKFRKEIDKKNEIRKLKKICRDQILITDVRGIDNEYFLTLNAVCIKTIYFDDLGDNDFSPHILINPSVVPSLQRYKKRQATTKYLIGVKFFILGDGFKRKGQIKKTVKNVLVSLGGADPANYTPSILKIIGNLDYDFKINLILGPAFIKFKEVDYIVKQMNRKIKILRNVANMGELMYDADIAFVSGGDTALELAYTGTSGFLVPTIYYENETAGYLEGKKVFVNLGDIKRKSDEEILKKIDIFWNDFNMRKEFSRNTKKFIDGGGLKRVFREISI